MLQYLQQTKRSCVDCGSFKTSVTNKKYEQWLKAEQPNTFRCHRCWFNKKGYNRNENKKRLNRKLNPRQITFKSRRIPMDRNMRTGFCTQCPNNIYDGSCKKTDLHHAKGYYIIFPLFGTVELCPACHRREAL